MIDTGIAGETTGETRRGMCGPLGEESAYPPLGV